MDAKETFQILLVNISLKHIRGCKTRQELFDSLYFYESQSDACVHMRYIFVELSKRNLETYYSSRARGGSRYYCILFYNALASQLTIHEEKFSLKEENKSAID
jgi:hypothetical protein